MGRIVTLTLNVQLIMVVDEGVGIDEIINEMDYDFYERTSFADILDKEITGFEIIDSK